MTHKREEHSRQSKENVLRWQIMRLSWSISYNSVSWWVNEWQERRLEKQRLVQENSYHIHLGKQDNKLWKYGKKYQYCIVVGEGNGTPLQYCCPENPRIEEPGGLQSMGSLRVRHDWATSLSLSTFMHWRRKWQPTPVFLPGESQGQRSLVGCSPWGCTESDTTEAT